MPRISAWEDDPYAQPSVQPISRPVPSTDDVPLPVRISERKPEAAMYAPGTREFRYWSGLDALARASAYWARAAAPLREWQSGGVLLVRLDRGVDLNAYYDREGLSFFHADVSGVVVHSGESPDVLCHEHGHALLDAVRPELWNAASLEADALHEAFGDISAMLAALQLPSVRAAVLAQTGGRVARASRLTRMAEQLGWAVRQFRPDAADPDCLRNAANSFFYREPSTLPPSAPSSSLSSEPHSFSRVFTAAWLESFAAMVDRAGVTSSALLTASRDAGRLLVEAVRDARVASNYFAQVAAHLLRAEARLFGGRDQQGIRAAFVRRGVLSVGSAASVVGQIRTAGPAGASWVPPPDGRGTAEARVRVNGALFGLRAREVVVDAPIDSARSVAASAALDLGSEEAVPGLRAAQAFVEVLLRRRRIDGGTLAARHAAPVRPGRTTHRLVRDGRTVRLIRTRFH
jgi:hypothetical protein